MIYFAQEASGHIKIGFTDGDPEDRVRALQTASPNPLTLLLAIEGMRQDESILHQRFASDRICGEWFKPGPSLVRFIIAQAASQGAAKAFESVREDTSKLTPWLLRIEPYFGTLLHDKQIGEPLLITCPVCGFEYNHISSEPSRYSFGERWHHKTVTFGGECGHRFSISFSFYKGNCYAVCIREEDDEIIG